jgi:hypothetical protein
MKQEYPGPLNIGSKGEHVKMVQRIVGATPDGDFGSATGKRVSAWRRRNGLGIGTKVGPKTWAKMFDSKTEIKSPKITSPNLRKPMTRKYTGNSDGLASGPKPGTQELLRLASKRWGFTNLGIFTNRRMNNDAAKKDPNNPKYLSVHATGRAVDMGYKDRKKAEEFWNFLIFNTRELGIEEIHDYAFDPDGKGPGKAWGAGYRCSRGENLAGVVIFDAKRNAGTPGGKWLHVELSPEMANDAKKFRAAWIACLKKSGLK